MAINLRNYVISHKAAGNSARCASAEERLAAYLRAERGEGVAGGGFGPGLDPVTTASTIVAVLRGGYVLARAADSVEPFTAAVDGVLDLLAARRTA